MELKIETGWFSSRTVPVDIIERVEMPGGSTSAFCMSVSVRLKDGEIVNGAIDLMTLESLQSMCIPTGVCHE